jgi:hypothetical protein
LHPASTAATIRSTARAVPDTREANAMETLIGIVLVLISAVLIVGIVRTVSANAPR